MVVTLKKKTNNRLICYHSYYNLANLEREDYLLPELNNKSESKIMKKNPKVKKGDKILLLSSQNMPQYVGMVLEVTTANTGDGVPYVKNPKNEKNGDIYLYPNDQFVIATKEVIIESKKSELETLEQSIAEIKKEIEFLEKYDTQEDFVAEKLENILTAHSKGKTAEERSSAIKEILLTLKSSDLI